MATYNRTENFDRHLKIDDKLDSHHKPVKIGEDITGLQLADKDVKIENDLIINGNLSVSGEIDGGSSQNNLKGLTTVGDENGENIAFSGSSIYIGEPNTYGLGTGAIAQLGANPFAANSTLLKLYSRENYANSVNMSVTTNGATTIETVDGGGTNAHLILNSDGNFTVNSGADIDLDSHTGNFTAKKGGDEFSATNSAYAGMILGYTRLQGDLTNQNVFEIQDDITVEDATHKITFKTPPSELVEIEVQVSINNATTDTTITTGLSDNSTYNSIGEEYEYDYLGLAFSDDEVDDHLHTVKWVLGADDLVAIGNQNELWVGFGTAGATKTAYITYGVRASHGICAPPFIIKATALPATIYDGQ